MLKYKGYRGQAIFDNDSGMLFGHVIGLKDIITFQAVSVKELEHEFKASIDFYLDVCKKRGEKPEKSFSGKLNIRIAPDLHAQLSQEALQQGVSLNSMITEKLKR